MFRKVREVHVNKIRLNPIPYHIIPLPQRDSLLKRLFGGSMARKSANSSTKKQSVERGTFLSFAVDHVATATDLVGARRARHNVYLPVQRDLH